MLNSSVGSLVKTWTFAANRLAIVPMGTYTSTDTVTVTLTGSWAPPAGNRVFTHACGDKTITYNSAAGPYGTSANC
jgi:hypothetical protein